jgi:hypothetical protein
MSNCDCGRMIDQPKTGRRRTKCETCSPRRERPDRGAPVLHLPSPGRSTPSGSGPGPERARRTLADATLADLVAAGREDTTKGLAALQLADLVDAGGYTAQGAAALVKAHREALELALAGAQVDADVIDLIFGQEA